jgi:hypothetical protein
MVGPTISDELGELHNEYVWEVNAAVERNDDEFVAYLSNEYTDIALRMISSIRRAS